MAIGTGVPHRTDGNGQGIQYFYDMARKGVNFVSLPQAHQKHNALKTHLWR
jgi:hypothetical protein